MEDLRLAFLFIGAVAILGILAHGMWSVRKNSQEKRDASLESEHWQSDQVDEHDESDDNLPDDAVVIDIDDVNERIDPAVGDNENPFDDLGLGPVRVVAGANDVKSNENDVETMPLVGTDLNENQAVSMVSQDASNETVEAKSAVVIDEPVAEQEAPKIYSSVVTQPKPEYAAQQVQAMRSRMMHGATDSDDIPEPPPFLLKPSQDGKDTSDPSISMPETDQSVSLAVDDSQEPKAITAEEKYNVEPLVESTPEIESAGSEETVPEQKVSLAEQARNFVSRTKVETKPKTKPRKRREPKFQEDQMRIDFDQSDTPQSEQSHTPDHDDSRVNRGSQDKIVAKSQGESSNAGSLQEVLVLNVRAKDEAPIQGAALLPMLLTLGFKFGDQDIFHRHVNSNGKGPVLFSLANMFKPGVFDIDNLENFNTAGLSLFMMLPIEGDPHQVFNMMHNAARKIADEFGAQVLDGTRSTLTKQSLQQYVEKIREFERQRMLNK